MHNKIITGWAPTMMRETAWYHWAYPELYFRKCPNYVIKNNNNNNLEIESIEHLLICKSNTKKIDLGFKNYFKKEETLLNNLLNIESKKKRSYLITPVHLYEEFNRIPKLLEKNTKKTNNIIKEIFSRKILDTYINTWIPRCKALELLENNTKINNKERRKLMKTRPTSENPKLEDDIPRVKKTITYLLRIIKKILKFIQNKYAY